LLEIAKGIIQAEKKINPEDEQRQVALAEWCHEMGAIQMPASIS
jgi:hypothetical protein